jgi:hypothetical protein
VGEGPRRTAFQEAIQAMVDTTGCWKETGDFMVPDTSPVTKAKYWHVMGGLLALALLTGDSLHPISPAVIYALLSNIPVLSDPRAPMHMSLSFIHQLSKSKARDLLPWMVLPPGQDWQNLPSAHRTLLRELITNLGIDVSGQPSSNVLL